MHPLECRTGAIGCNLTFHLMQAAQASETRPKAMTCRDEAVGSLLFWGGAPGVVLVLRFSGFVCVLAASPELTFLWPSSQ